MDKYNKQKVLLRKSTYSSLIYQITTIICGFIIPRIILVSYGSRVNGLVSSIKQFLSVISFLELGVGAVVQSALYKPLAEKDASKVNQIISSANNFFTNIGKILLIYVIVLCTFYPLSVIRSFPWVYTVLLIVATSISLFSQYFFGIVDRLFLTSAQYGYIQYNAQTATLILNAVACYLLAFFNVNIQTFQLISSLIYLIRPAYLRVYVNKKFHLQRHVHYDKEPIPQKWNGIAQHIAAVVLDGTDVIVLTLFSTLANVSIYSVYNIVVYGVKTLMTSITNGVQALEGELWVENDSKRLYSFFHKTEWMIHMCTVFLFSCTAVLLTPFVLVYTKGVNDINYFYPMFALLITIANACHCFRLPYNLMILAAGHYKQTQKVFMISALLNITISIALVTKYGLIGVSIGTIVGMSYMTVWMAIYNSKYLIKDSLKKFIKLIIIDFASSIIIFCIGSKLKLSSLTYLSWLILAIKIVGISISVLLIINFLFYKKYTISLFKRIKNRVI